MSATTRRWLVLARLTRLPLFIETRHRLYCGVQQSWVLPHGRRAAANALPSEIMLRSAPLVQAVENDEATFWLYAGQLHWRSRLDANR